MCILLSFISLQTQLVINEQTEMVYELQKKINYIIGCLRGKMSTLVFNNKQFMRYFDDDSRRKKTSYSALNKCLFF